MSHRVIGRRVVAVREPRMSSREALARCHARAAAKAWQEKLSDPERIDYYAGLAIGPPTQASTYVLLEQAFRGGRTYYTLTGMTRWPARSPLRDIVGAVGKLWAEWRIQHTYHALAIDITVIGRLPLEDFIREAEIEGPGLYVISDECDPAPCRVSRRDLIGLMQALLNEQRIAFAEDVPDVDGLVRELKGVPVRVQDDGRAVYGGGGAYPSRTIAVALGLWNAEWWRGETRG